jgi:dTDP-glucose 4,6-dehydratase/UDP-glucose 4-epimerase
MNGECYNIANGVSVSIKDIATQLLLHLGYTNELNFNGTPRQGNPLSWQADINKLKNLGFETKVNLNLGLSKTAAWLKLQNV